MYNIEEDIVPPELLAQALAVSTTSVIYKVYFDKDTGNILSVTNEESSTYDHFVEFEFNFVKDFLNSKLQLRDYIITFVDQSTPKIVSKYQDDIQTVTLMQVPSVDNWDSMFTIENYPLVKQWGFQVRPDQKDILEKYNINTTLEIYIVDKNNMNFIYRTVKLLVNDLIKKDREFVSYLTDKEGDISNIAVYVKHFFSSVGYQILYDTNS
jgi:hypothetical protein